MRSRVLLAGVLLSSAAGCEGRFYYDGPRATADAGPDQMARDQFAAEVAPIMAMKCDTCHKTGQLMAPIFEATYDSVTAYAMAHADPPFLHCSRPAESRLLVMEPHVGEEFDTVTEAPIVSAWLTLWAMTSPDCAGMIEEDPVTAPFVLQNLGVNEVPLSETGAGLGGALLRFTLSSAGGGLLLSQLELVAGGGGLHVVHPVFETCAMPPDADADIGDSFNMVDLTIEPGQTATLPNRMNVPTLSLTGRSLGVPLAIRFETITPSTGSVGPAVDNGGACAP